MLVEGFPSGQWLRNSSAKAEDKGLIPGPGKSHLCHKATKPACPRAGALHQEKPLQ